MLFFMFVSWWGMDGVEGPGGWWLYTAGPNQQRDVVSLFFLFFRSTLTALLWEFALLFHR